MNWLERMRLAADGAEQRRYFLLDDVGLAASAVMLSPLHCRLYEQVANNRIGDARESLDAIERWSSELLAEQEKGK